MWNRCIKAALVLACLPVLGDSKEEAQALVKKAIAFYKAEGKEKMIIEVGRPGGQLRKGLLYVFVYDMNGVVVAHGQLAKLVGTNLYNSKDPSGKFWVQERIALANEKGQGWQSYVFMNPLNKRWEPKTAYIEKCDYLVFGCGVYR